jgi:hypothetical protein
MSRRSIRGDIGVTTGREFDVSTGGTTGQSMGVSTRTFRRTTTFHLARLKDEKYTI